MPRFGWLGEMSSDLPFGFFRVWHFFRQADRWWKIPETLLLPSYSYRRSTISCCPYFQIHSPKTDRAGLRNHEAEPIRRDMEVIKVFFTIAVLNPKSGGPSRSVPDLCSAL